MRGFYETDKKAKPSTRAEDIRRRALAREKAETPPRVTPKAPTDIDTKKVLKGLSEGPKKAVRK